MASKTKQDWIEEGLNIVAENGINGLTVELLTNRLNMTKGSFYHHFKNFQDFKEALLTYFEEKGTIEIISLVEEAPTPLEKIKKLLQVAPGGPVGLEFAIRVWSIQDPLAQVYQERTDFRRLSYLQELCQKLIPETEKADTLAHLLYAAFVGSQQIRPPLSIKKTNKVFQEILRLYNLE
jgi:AcrR family transcriptional regulator